MTAGEAWAGPAGEFTALARILRSVFLRHGFHFQINFYLCLIEFTPVGD